MNNPFKGPSGTRFLPALLTKIIHPKQQDMLSIENAAQHLENVGCEGPPRPKR
jgi:hypothetical protein